MHNAANDVAPACAQGFLLMHRAMRVDLDRLLARLADPRALDAREAAALGDWFGFFTRALREHHEGEDLDLFPLLRARAPHAAEALDVLEREHADLDAAVDAARAHLAAVPAGGDGPERRAARVSLGRLRELLHGHLAREEAAVVPAMAAHVSEDEVRDIERRMQRRTPLRDIALVLPWIIDASAPEEEARILSKVPLPLRLMYKLVWRRRWDALTAPLAAARAA